MKALIIAALIVVASSTPCEPADPKTPPPMAKNALAARSLSVENGADYMFVRNYECNTDSGCDDCELARSLITHKCLEDEVAGGSIEASCNGTITYKRYTLPDCQGTPVISYVPTNVCLTEGEKYFSNNCYSPCL